MIKFVHTADWQIGKPFGNIDGDQAAFLRKQRIETVGKIGAIAGQEKADFILVAGDVFDSNLPESKSVLQTFKVMAESFGGKWFLLPGNHDAAETQSVWTRIKKDFSSDNISILDEPKARRIPELGTVILPAPLKRRHESSDLTEWWDSYESSHDDIRIGLAHGSLDALSQYRGEAPNTIALSRIQSAKIDYLALGDWHGTISASKRAYYSGTPEPDRFKANESGNIIIAEIEAPGKEPVVQIRSTKHYLWQLLDNSIFRAADILSIRQQLQELNHPLDRIALRMSLKGSLSFEERALLDKEIEQLNSELFYVESDLSGLLAEPSNEDLDEIEQSGFVRTAVDKLMAMMRDTNNPDAEKARLALHILYVENKEISQC